MDRQRVAVAFLTVSTAGILAWNAQESFTDRAIVPTKGDRPTIGFGSTRYEDGTPVRMGDTITRERAAILAQNLRTTDEKRFAATVPGVHLYQAEFDIYMDFVGQFGIGAWRSSSMRRDLLAGNFTGACQALLRYRFSAGYDCSRPGNKVCRGVWSRQQERHRRCMEAQ